MTMSPDAQKRNEGSIASLRIIFWLFIVVGYAVIFCGVVVFFDPNATVIINGVKKADTASKLVEVLLPLGALGFGLFLASARAAR